MYVTVTAAGVQIGAADDCTSLDVRAAPGLRSSLDEALRQADLGRWDGGDEADLELAELRRLSRVQPRTQRTAGSATCRMPMLHTPSRPSSMSWMPAALPNISVLRSGSAGTGATATDTKRHMV